MISHILSMSELEISALAAGYLDHLSPNHLQFRSLRRRDRPTSNGPIQEIDMSTKQKAAIATSPTFSRRFCRVAAGLVASLALGALSAQAAPTPFPADFRSSQVVNADATINVRVDGRGPAVVLSHGFGETGDMGPPVAAEVANDHTV